MIDFIGRYIRGRDFRFHFFWALLLAFLTRSICAYFVYGPQALDDYKHGVWPAYQFFVGMDSSLPEYRSFLLVWVLSAFVYTGHFLGLDSALAQVRWMYFGLGILSLTALWGTAIYYRALRKREEGILALYLLALFPIFPFIATRAFGEAVAMGFVLWGLGRLEATRIDSSSNWFNWTIGFFILGVASLFRFHCGLIYLVYAGCALVSLNSRRSRLAAISGFLAASALSVTAQAMIDLLSDREPLSTLFVYLTENAGGAEKYGVSPWFNPLLFIAGLALIPFSLTLVRQWRSVLMEHWRIAIPLFIFVLAHCLVPHKEERFLYPIVGLVYWLFASAWWQGFDLKWVRRVLSPLVVFLVFVGTPIVITTNSQEGEIEPPAYVESHFKKAVYLDYKSLFSQSRFRFYFLRPPHELIEVPFEGLNLARGEEVLAQDPSVDAVVFITSEAKAFDQLATLSGIGGGRLACNKIRWAGSLVDRLIYRMNPKHNMRRRPTAYMVCEPRGV